MPTSFEAQAAHPPSSCAAAALPLPNAQAVPLAPEIQRGEVEDYYAFRKFVDIKWDLPLHEQLEPQFFGGPDPKRSKDELRALRR